MMIIMYVIIILKYYYIEVQKEKGAAISMARSSEELASEKYNVVAGFKNVRSKLQK